MAVLQPLTGTNFYLWKYLPSIPAAVVFLIAFIAVTVPLCWRIHVSRSRFCIPFALGGVFQITGYVVRILSHFRTYQIAPYVVQNAFIILAPIFYAATIYMMLGRLIISVHGDRLSVVRPGRMTKIFVAGDLLSLTVQGNAVGFTARKNPSKAAEYVIIAGLFIQLIVFGFFMIAAVVFHKRMRRQEGDTKSEIPWRRGMKMLYACSTLIIVRSIFRVVEYIMGVDGYLLSTEWPMYVFDGVLMWTAQLIFLIWFPHQFHKRRVESDESRLVDLGKNGEQVHGSSVP